MQQSACQDKPGLSQVGPGESTADRLAARRRQRTMTGLSSGVKNAFRSTLPPATSKSPLILYDRKTLDYLRYPAAFSVGIC